MIFKLATASGHHEEMKKINSRESSSYWVILGRTTVSDQHEARQAGMKWPGGLSAEEAGKGGELPFSLIGGLSSPN